jgi:hypothetical protein
VLPLVHAEAAALSALVTQEALAILFKANHTRRQVYNAMT